MAICSIDGCVDETLFTIAAGSLSKTTEFLGFCYQHCRLLVSFGSGVFYINPKDRSKDEADKLEALKLLAALNCEMVIKSGDMRIVPQSKLSSIIKRIKAKNQAEDTATGIDEIEKWLNEGGADGMAG